MYERERMRERVQCMFELILEQNLRQLHIRNYINETFNLHPKTHLEAEDYS